MATLDVQRLALPDVPPGWQDVPAELVARLLPDPTKGYHTPEQTARITRIVGARWFLVRNEWRARCRHCNQIHDYVSLACEPRPFNGLNEIVLLLEERSSDGRHRETLYSSVGVGTLVPLSIKEARRLVARINAKGYALRAPEPAPTWPHDDLNDKEGTP